MEYIFSLDLVFNIYTMFKNYLSFYFVLISALVISLSSIAQSPSESSKFRSINELKSAAKEQSKLILVQFYSDKTIDELKKIDGLINSANVNEYLDSKFIRLKLDFNKNNAIINSIKNQIVNHEYYNRRFSVSNAIYLFSNKMKFLHLFILEKQSQDSLIGYFNSIQQEENQLITQLNKYKDNNKDAVYLSNLYRLVSNAYRFDDRNQLQKEVSSSLAKYSHLDSFFQAKNASLVKKHVNDTLGEVFNIVLKNLDKYKLIDTINDVNDVLAEIIIDHYINLINLQNKAVSGSDIDKLFKGKYATINYHKMKWTKIINQTFYTDNANAIAFIDSILAHNVSYRPQDLNSWIYKLFSGKQEVFYFQKAYQWAAILTKTYPQNYHYLETKAIALYNINRTEEAISVVNNILKMPIEEKDVVYYTKLLNRMKSEE